MPIKSLTDQVARFPEIGQIRKGAAKTEQNGKSTIGRDLDYFRVEIDARESESIKAFKLAYGDKPQELNVLLAFNEIDKVFDAWLEAYTAGRMVARADGEKYLYLVDTKTGEVLIKNGEPYREYKEGEVIGTWFNEKTKKDEPIRCRPVGRLRVVIPELKRLAYLTVMTTSIHDIINLSSQINALALINGGKVAGIPLVLSRRPKEISTPAGRDGKRARYTKWLLSIEVLPSWASVKFDSMAALSMPESVQGYLGAGEHPIKSSEPEPQSNYQDEEDDADIPANVTEGSYEEVKQEVIAETPPAPKAEITKTDLRAMAGRKGVDAKGLDEILNRTNGDLNETYEQLKAL